MVIPHLDLIIPLVGITVGSIIAFFLPGLFDVMTFWDDRRLESKKIFVFCLVKDLCLMILGIFALIVGLYSNIVAISQRN